MIFDTTDANTILDSDSVGAFIRSSDGTLLTHTDVGGKQSLDVNVANDISIAVSHVDDSIKIGDGTDFMEVNANGSINVEGSDFDIRDLAFATDSVDVSGSSVTVNDAALADSAIIAGAEALSVASTAQDVVGSPLANRKYLMIYNEDNRKMYVGQSGVTEANGFPVSPGSVLELRAGASVDVEYVSAKSGHKLRHLELS